MSSRNSAYSPLPQSNSDSEDSSEDLGRENGIASNNSNAQNINIEKLNNSQCNVINYKLLDPDGDIGAKLINFNSDEVSILKPKNKVILFSTSRKFYFVFSLLLCALTTIVFLWFLPCNDKSCFSRANKNKTLYWEKTLKGIELAGPISLYTEVSNNVQHLVFITKNLVNNISSENINKPGLISFDGITGMEKWNNTLSKEPMIIDCNLIDMNLDGQTDCLVLGSDYLLSLDSVTGKKIWDVFDHFREEMHIEKIDFPLIINDLDGDYVNDLLTLCQFGKKSQQTGDLNLYNNLTVISGRTGNIFNKPIEIKFCTSVQDLRFENTTFSYRCNDSNGVEFLQTISLNDLLKSLNGMPAQVDKIIIKVLYHANENSNSININGHRVLVDNFGHCPKDCYSLLNIKDERNNNSVKSVYNYSEKNTYCILPIVPKPNEATDIVLKFLKWKSKEIDHFENYITNTLNVKVRKKENKLLNFKDLDNEILLESRSSVNRSKRGTKSRRDDNLQTDLMNSNGFNTQYIQVILENVIALRFNNSQYSARNISQGEIIQICKENQICHPDVSQQKHSLMSADLNGDGKFEIISFHSNFVQEAKYPDIKSKSWLLQSFIKVFTI